MFEIESITAGLQRVADEGSVPETAQYYENMPMQYMELSEAVKK